MMPELETPAPAKAQQAWSLVRLGDICEPVKGVSSSFFNQNDEFKYIDIASIDRETKQIIASSTIPSKEAPSRAKYPLLKGDILVSTVRPNLNAVAMVNDYYEGTIASSGFCVLRTLQNEILSDYLFFFTRTNTFVEYLNSLATGASYPAVNDKIVKSAQIPLPPLAEQQRIVVRLDLAQRLIDQRKAQLALMDQLVQSLFYEMFGDPVKNEMGWEMSTIGDACYFVKDGPHKSLEYVDSGIPFVSVKDIINGYWDFSGVRYISESVYNEHKNRCKPEKGDILYTKGGTTGFAKYVDIDIDFLNWVHIAVLKFDKSKINGKFYESMLNHSYCYAQSQRYTRGVANRDLVLGEMKKISHFLPPLPLQQTFADRVQQIEALKQQMQASLAELEQGFQALMQEAFGH